MAQVTIVIDGKQYRMACDEGQEEHLTEMGQKFDRYVAYLKGSFGEIGDQRLTVMAALTVADELSEQAYKMLRLQDEVAALQDARLVAAERHRAEEAEAARAWRELGASIIGGCCGTQPGHIRVLSAEC